jgi:hypothetical protein
MLQALCERIDVPFVEEMLSWPAGPRETDGAWAPHWYGKVYATTGFGKYRAPVGPLPPYLVPILEEVRPLYDRLYAQRLRPATADLAATPPTGS